MLITYLYSPVSLCLTGIFLRAFTRELADRFRELYSSDLPSLPGDWPDWELCGRDESDCCDDVSVVEVVGGDNVGEDWDMVDYVIKEKRQQKVTKRDTDGLAEEEELPLPPERVLRKEVELVWAETGGVRFGVGDVTIRELEEVGEFAFVWEGMEGRGGLSPECWSRFFCSRCFRLVSSKASTSAFLAIYSK